MLVDYARFLLFSVTNSKGLKNNNTLHNPSLIFNRINQFSGTASIFAKPEPKPLNSTVKIILIENELEEKFVKGSGPGGQKINKCKHCVQLKHLPTGLTVETQRFRELTNNRKEARKLLTLQLDKLYNGQDSKIERKIDKLKKQKRNRNRKALKKYGKDVEGVEDREGEGGEDLSDNPDKVEKDQIVKQADL
jgi:protein subunit release factor B